MQLRHAQGKDADAGGQLIFSSAARSLSYLFDVSEQHQALGFIQHALTLADGQFGHNNHWVIDINGQVAAIISAWHTDLAPSFHQATLHSIAGYYGLIDSLTVVQRAQTLKDIISPPQKDEWCIGHFAVAPAYRRCGLATKLLAHMHGLATKNGKHKLCLDVELDNYEAINFYHDAGFVFAEQATSKTTGDRALAAHGHMFLAL
jgi:ribosomal protein S18 acetylase RimI-like enzyme